MADFGASLFSSIGSFFGASSAATLPSTASLASVPGGTAALAGNTAGFSAAQTAAAAGAGLTVAEALNYGATGLSIAGQAIQGAAAAGQASEQAKQGERQAELIEQQTELQDKADEYQLKRLMAHNRNVAAGSNVGVFSGSPLEIELANAYWGTLNRKTNQYAGGLQAANARLGAAYSRGTIPGIIGGTALRAGSTALGDMYLQNKGYGYSRRRQSP